MSYFFTIYLFACFDFKDIELSLLTFVTYRVKTIFASVSN